jgi:hypothetical protein
VSRITIRPERAADRERMPENTAEVLPENPEPESVPLDPLERLELALDASGYRVARIESRSGTRALLIHRGEARAAIVGTDVAERDAATEIEVLRRLAPNRPLRVLAFGPLPDSLGRRRLRDVGVELALDAAMPPHVLRFQVNRALVPPEAPTRGAPRAPLDLEVTVRRGFQSRAQRLYTLSATGAFVLTDRPLTPGRRLWLEVPAGLLQPKARARVVLANRPDAPVDAALPAGMAVAFEGLDPASAAVLDRLVRKRLEALAI